MRFPEREVSRVLKNVAILLRGRGTNLSFKLVIKQDVRGFDVPVDDPWMTCNRNTNKIGYIFLPKKHFKRQRNRCPRR
jgi:hypothetical protein